VAVFLILLVLTLIFKLIKGTWFGKGLGHGEEVAVIDVSGMMVGATSTLRELDDIQENKAIKAVVVHINSPGGLVAPSQEIYEAFRRLDKKMPVIISMASLAASGGYYAALGGRKIFANPGTLTASIGVIMELANTEKLYHWAKVDKYDIKAGKFKDIGTPLRAMTDEERVLLSNMLTDIHRQFRATVKERRKLTDAELDAVADGRVMTGAQAKAAKLVDELGGLQDALHEAKAQAKLPEDAHVEYISDEHEGLLKKLVLGSLADNISALQKSIEALSQATGQADSTSPGWRIMLLAPVR